MGPTPYREDLEETLSLEMAGGGGPGGLRSNSEDEDASHVRNARKGPVKRSARTITKKKKKKRDRRR